jgi:restriction system protein
MEGHPTQVPQYFHPLQSPNHRKNERIMTIVDAIRAVMGLNVEPMTTREVYDAIVAQNLYTFHAARPAEVVSLEIRRHCLGVEMSKTSPRKYFRLVDHTKYALLPMTSQLRMHIDAGAAKHVEESEDPLSLRLRDLRQAYHGYEIHVKSRMLSDLQQLPPRSFELFSKKLLEVYGFEDTEVTQVSKDGGIDGYGRLKVGLAKLDVAFQCKRYVNTRVQRQHIDTFRGAIAGRFDQGYFFTTSDFTKGAIGDSKRPGAPPIVLVNGDLLVDLMVDKSFGVIIEAPRLPVYALDLAFIED